MLSFFAIGTWVAYWEVGSRLTQVSEVFNLSVRITYYNMDIFKYELFEQLNKAGWKKLRRMFLNPVLLPDFHKKQKRSRENAWAFQ